MAIVEIKVPEVGESITEGFLAEWLKADGDVVERDEGLLVVETDKITVTVNADSGGRLSRSVAEGETVQIGQVVGTLDTDAAPAAEATATEDAAPSPAAGESEQEVAQTPRYTTPAGVEQMREKLEPLDGLAPSVQRLVIEHHLDPAAIEGTGKDGRLTKADVLRHLETRGPSTEAPQAKPPAPKPEEPPQAGTAAASPAREGSEQRQTRRPMSMLRQRVAERLVAAQHNAAMLTTFNEADLSRVMALRARFRDKFKNRHDVDLGFMSFFVKASVEALKSVPEANAFIEGDQIVDNHYYDIGVAISTDKGLVVPVVRDADRLSMADIERQIASLAERARSRRLELSDLTGAVFTISNGGIFGSMLSTPILNPPQSAILGMHAIKKRPVVVDDEIVIRPMMYLAVSYDHRIIDGREAVTFLKRIVECIENPERMLLEV